MLVPLDGSELAEVVLVYAKELAGRLDLDTIFLHVCSPEESEPATMHRSYVEHVAETIRHQSIEVQEKAGIETGGRSVESQGVLAVGNPAEEIIRYVDENSIDLILMATHGRSGIGRLAMGSVADKIIRSSKVPVWLVRAGISENIVYDKWPRKTILVPLDGSELAESVLPHVEVLAKQRDGESVDVVVLRVCEYAVVPDDNARGVPSGWEKGIRREIARSKREAGTYLAEVENRLKDADLEVQSVVLVGEPPNEIINFANAYPFTLIALATHGRSGLKRWANGSVADKVLRAASCPLFVVRPS
jgi:nucleotide-binding universal stress UspA family protein